MRRNRPMQVVDEKGQRSWADALGEYIPFGFYLYGVPTFLWGCVTWDLRYVVAGTLAVAAAALIRRLLWGPPN